MSLRQRHGSYPQYSHTNVAAYHRRHPQLMYYNHPTRPSVSSYWWVDCPIYMVLVQTGIVVVSKWIWILKWRIVSVRMSDPVVDEMISHCHNKTIVMLILWSNNTMPHTIPILEPKYMIRGIYIYIYDNGIMWARHPLKNIQLPVHLLIPVREKERPSQLTMVVYCSNVLSFMTNQLTLLSCILFVSLTGTRRYYVLVPRPTTVALCYRNNIVKNVAWSAYGSTFVGPRCLGFGMSCARAKPRPFVCDTWTGQSCMSSHVVTRWYSPVWKRRKSQVATHENDRLCHYGNNQVNKYTAQQALDQLYSYIIFTS